MNIGGGAPPVRTSRLSARNSRMSARQSRMGDGEGGGGGRPQVYDEYGRNVTPRPLLGGARGGISRRGTDDGGRMSRMSFESRLAGLERIGSLKSGLMLAHGSSVSMVSGPSEEPTPDPLKQAAEHELVEEESLFARPEAAPAAMLTDRDLQRLVSIVLEETETVWLLDIPSVCVNAESDEGKKVLEANKRYKQLLQDKHQGGDRYASAGIQTMPTLQKNAETQSATVRTAVAACQASTWDNFDSLEVEAAAEEEKGGQSAFAAPSSTQDPGGNRMPLALAGSSAMAGAGAGPSRSSAVLSASAFAGSNVLGSSMTVGDGSAPMRASGVGVGGEVAGAAVPDASALEATALLERVPRLDQALVTAEKAVSQNLFHRKLLRYKDVLPAEEAAGKLPGVKGPVTPPNARKTKGNDAQGAEPTPSGRAARRGYPPAASRQASIAGSEEHAASLASRRASVSSERGDHLDEEDDDHDGAFESEEASDAEHGAEEELEGEESQKFETASFAGSQRMTASHAHGTPDLQLLWTFQCAMTEGRNITAMSWNKTRPDLLAVSYGQIEFFCRGSLPATIVDRRRSLLDAALGLTEGARASQQAPPADGASEPMGASSAYMQGGGPRGHSATQPAGLICLWSLQNPQWPLWCIETASGVTSLDFSKHHSTLLAVGMYDGGVAVYDVRDRDGAKPSAVSMQAAGNHSDPVWQVQWVELGDRGEKIISISTDGRVTQWSLTKGLEFNDLMRLKKASNPLNQQAAKTGGSEGFMSMRSSGLCFDFSWMDSTVYLAGTEEGHIHKCSVSYSEQYLHSYFGHMGPVYSVRFSPFSPSVFLSASSDWTVRLWSEEKQEPLLVFQTGKSAVNDVRWCPHNSTVFADVTDSGAVEVWDMAISTLRPVVGFAHPEGDEHKFISLLFSDNDPILVAATSNGSVCVFRHEGLLRKDQMQQQQVARLEETIKSNLLQSEASKGKVLQTQSSAAPAAVPMAAA